MLGRLDGVMEGQMSHICAIKRSAYKTTIHLQKTRAAARLFPSQKEMLPVTTGRARLTPLTLRTPFCALDTR